MYRQHASDGCISLTRLPAGHNVTCYYGSGNNRVSVAHCYLDVTACLSYTRLPMSVVTVLVYRPACKCSFISIATVTSNFLQKLYRTQIFTAPARRKRHYDKYKHARHSSSLVAAMKRPTLTLFRPTDIIPPP